MKRHFTINGKIILVFNFYCILLLFSCQQKLEIEAISKMSWFDLDYQKEEKSFTGEDIFLNEVFFEVEDDNFKLIELFGNGVPTSFVIYSMKEQIGLNHYLMYSERLDKELEFRITKDTNIILKRPLLNVEESEILRLVYLKQNQEKKYLRKVFFEFDKFEKNRIKRKYSIIDSLAIEYHSNLVNSVKY